jgi:hypothetical protein
MKFQKYLADNPWNNPKEFYNDKKKYAGSFQYFVLNTLINIAGKPNHLFNIL